MFVHVVDHGATGAHWDTMRPVDDYLREALEDLAAALRINAGRAEQPDYSRLELDHVWEQDHSPSDTAWEWFAGAVLEVQTASWDDRDALPDADSPRALCRVEVVFGTGGPHVELVGIYGHAGECRRVEAHQYWSGHREAWADTSDATDTFAAAVAAFVRPE